MNQQSVRTSPSENLPTPRHFHFSLRNSLVSTFGSSSRPSHSTASSNASTPNPEARFRLSMPLRDTRSMLSSGTIRSRSSTRSLIDPANMAVNNPRPLHLPRLASEDPRMTLASAPVVQQSARAMSATCLEEMVLHQEVRLSRGQQNRQRRRSPFTRHAFRQPSVRSKASLSMALGFTLTATLAVYLGLAIAGVGVGILFHTLFILTVLAFTAAFCHSLLRMLMAILHPPGSRPNFNNRRWHHRGRSLAHNKEGTVSCIHPPKKPIRIILASDEDEEAQATMAINGTVTNITEKLVIRPPPPVYGEYRDSQRLNPNLVHWQKVPPSPLTPTYDEAMTQARQALGGFRPPSYASERGLGQESEQGRYWHPLERKRMPELMGQAV